MPKNAAEIIREGKDDRLRLYKMRADIAKEGFVLDALFSAFFTFISVSASVSYILKSDPHIFLVTAIYFCTAWWFDNMRTEYYEWQKRQDDLMMQFLEA